MDSNPTRERRGRMKQAAIRDRDLDLEIAGDWPGRDSRSIVRTAASGRMTLMRLAMEVKSSIHIMYTRRMEEFGLARSEIAPTGRFSQPAAPALRHRAGTRAAQPGRRYRELSLPLRPQTASWAASESPSVLSQPVDRPLRMPREGRTGSERAPGYRARSASTECRRRWSRTRRRTS